MQLHDQIKHTCMWHLPLRTVASRSSSPCTRGQRTWSPLASFVDCRLRWLTAILLVALPAGASAQVDDGLALAERGSIVLSNLPGSAGVQPALDAIDALGKTGGQAEATSHGLATKQDAGEVEQGIDLRRLITQVARESGVGADLIAAVAAAESRFDPTARSPKGAQGLMQLMPATARRFGVKDVWKVEDNLRGGAAYLRWLLDLFGGDVSLAVAAYNAGENAVLKAGRRIPAYSETRNYVPRVLAWREQYAAEFKLADQPRPTTHVPAKPTGASQGSVSRQQLAQSSASRQSGLAPTTR